MFQLHLSNLHFLGSKAHDQQRDFCLHGDVAVSLGKEVIRYEGASVTGSALQFMRSGLFPHTLGEGLQILPCCGHFWIAAEDGQSVEIFGCDGGIDFDISHHGEEIVIRTEAGKFYQVPQAEYRAAVLAFAEEVEACYRASPEKIPPNDPFERAGFQAFQKEWIRLKKDLKVSDAILSGVS